MCGRFSYGVSKSELELYVTNAFQISAVPDNLTIPRYNVAPSQKVLAVIHDGSRHRLGEIKWGYVPSYSTDESVGYSMINARAETIREKFAFQHAFKTRRCVILADGFYEWDHHGKLKTPYRFTLKRPSLFAMAGLWSSHVKPDGSKHYTCTIITCEANELLSSVHDRMPVIFDDETARAWLNPNEMNYDHLHQLLQPYPANNMNIWEISSKINNPQCDDKECVEPIKKSPN